MVQAGEFNMALPAFMAIGAYCTALLTTKHDLNWWLAMPTAGVLAAAMATVLGRVVLRVKGIYFAILAFGIVMVIRFVWLAWPDTFGGASGIANIPTVDGLSGSLASFFYLGLAIALLTLIVYYRLEHSRYGLTLNAIGQADALAESIGVNVMRYKVSVFAVTAFFAGIAGAFFASMQHFIDPEEFGFNMSLLVVVYAVISGLRSFWGPAIGVPIMLSIPILLKEIPGYDPKIEPIIMGVGLATIMIALPQGMVGWPRVQADQQKEAYRKVWRPLLVKLHLKAPLPEPLEEK
jgi:branched-chain amino acid transport system permease protein